MPRSSRMAATASVREIAAAQTITPIEVNDLIRPAPQPAAATSVGPAEPTRLPHQPPASPAAIISYIDLEVEARSVSNVDELRYLIVNSTRKLAPYDQAFLLEQVPGKERWKITCGSSVASVDRDSEAARLIEDWANHPQFAQARKATPNLSRDIPADIDAWGLEDRACTFPHALWIEIAPRARKPLAGLLLLKAGPWDQSHLTLITSLAGAYAHAWSALAPPNRRVTQKIGRFFRSTKALWLGSAALVLASFIPVPMTVLAPAEIVGTSPALVTAPIDGVIRDILIPPGQHVEMGQPIVTLVDTKLRNDVEIAIRAKGLAEAKYFKALQSAVSSQKDVQDISIAKAEHASAEAELAYARELLARAELKAPRSGLLIYSAKSDWIGKPVSTGERIMEIADPSSVELRIDVPISDSMALVPGSDVKLFLDGEPLRPIMARIERMAYRATPTADHQLAFRTFAKFTDAEPLRIGLHGTARLHGENTTLGFYLFRRPIAMLRQKIGL